MICRKQIQELKEDIRNSDILQDTKDVNAIFMMYFACVFFWAVLLFYLYRVILRPFDKLEHYAVEIAKGNFSES